ncbi:GCN5-related N-acetyltransferase [Cellulomonas flavigena DSM 20109]|uniref:GCN5-related N-acetyltransferase n=1 Tax=Cellulomonas flavigena (strain ATCC 482 / DSM 20109 / BCRC 11376 / JCM 18109 / NBRC 3775 / NCIMB 8073 / NRS 134) TaxID=446466 RepID=D5ULH6_CELFN|nr:GNAT family N-acetyltransferase [Cellulomonas flavigena]ADG74018.1 GCN5-related N-acetyltransferase [Cellulomonas flavigena DSM 20109]
MSGSSRPAVVVRPVEPQDHARVGGLTVAAYVADGLVEPGHWYTDELRDTAARAADATVLVATAPSTGRAQVLGTITLATPGSRYAEIAQDGELELRMLAVDPGARRAGVAEQLVLAALREAVGRGARTAVLSTLDTMHAAHRLYARLGFVPRPERDWTDELTMRVHTWDVPEAPGALVESATWPPLRVVDVDGWRVGLSGGVTRRASSTLALTEVADLEATLDRVEALYREDGAPAAIRVGDPHDPPTLAPALDARGYQVAAVTDVLVRDLPAAVVDAPTGVDVRVADAPDDAWLDVWLSGKGGAREPSARIVAGARAHYLTAAGVDGDVAVIRAAHAHDWVALSCLQVVPRARRRGLGRALTLRALALAADHGARRAFLQVETGNAAAVRLYDALGFRPAHRYAYLVQPWSGSATSC